MTNKILITLCVPMIEEEYDLYIPVSKNIGVVIDLLIKAVNELSEGQFPITKKCIIMSSNGIAFDFNHTIKESGIRNGDKLVLI